jgi:hypothetical protein
MCCAVETFTVYMRKWLVFYYRPIHMLFRVIESSTYYALQNVALDHAEGLLYIKYTTDRKRAPR